MPTISIIIPMKNAEATLTRCLESVFASTHPPLEVIVVDDGSTDRSREIAGGFPVRLARNDASPGVSHARNLGAREARGEVLFFTDSDVVLEPRTLAVVAERLADGALDGVVGVQTEAPAFTNFCSDYKNLWLRYTYLKLEGDLSVLYSSVVAIRREAFLRAEGFDAHYRRPNIEDSDLGKRLAERGARLRVEPAAQVVHIKHYDLWSLLVTDFYRSSGLMRVQLRDRFRRLARGNYTSIPTPFVASVVAWWLAVLAIAAALAGARSGGAAFITPATAATIAGALLLAILLLLGDLLGFFTRARGPIFVLRVLLLLPLDYAAITLGLAHGAVAFVGGRKW
ncbi:MAG: glycosyltransferase family 2 protein [bacterium]